MPHNNSQSVESEVSIVIADGHSVGSGGGWFILTSRLSRNPLIGATSNRVQAKHTKRITDEIVLFGIC